MNHVFMSLTLAALLAVFSPASPVVAQTDTADAAVTELPERIAALVKTMQIDRMLDVMQQEGLSYAETLDDEMLGGAAGAGWQNDVSKIYDPVALLKRVEATIAREYASDASTLDATEAFFSSPEGQKILSLEVEARRTLLDKGAKDAAEVTVEKMRKDRDPRLDLLHRFAEANDLLDMNVAGAMSSNLAFYKGLAAEGAFDNELTEDQMLSEVWNQEPKVREDSEKWLYSFLALAYAPLSDAELESYIAYSQTAAGERLNAVLFAAFDESFRDISYQLGRAAARQMQGSDI